jgi:hypothetical protein
VARFRKRFDLGLGINASYTFQDIEDVNATTSATAGSLYANNQFADPNKAAYGTSVYQIRHSLKAGIDFSKALFGGDYQTRFSIFGERRSGRPYSFTFRDPVTTRSPVFGTTGSSSRYLLYVPAAQRTRSSPTTACDAECPQRLHRLDEWPAPLPRPDRAEEHGALAELHQGRPALGAGNPDLCRIEPDQAVRGHRELPQPARQRLGRAAAGELPAERAAGERAVPDAAVPTGTPVGNVGTTPPANGVAAVATTPPRPARNIATRRSRIRWSRCRTTTASRSTKSASASASSSKRPYLRCKRSGGRGAARAGRDRHLVRADRDADIVAGVADRHRTLSGQRRDRDQSNSGGVGGGATWPVRVSTARDMKLRQIWAGRVPPVTLLPSGLLSSLPIQTPVTRSPAKPMNSASRLSWVVPVLPKPGRAGRRRGRCPG